MHELGIVMEIFDLIDEISEEQQLKKINSVTVEVGEFCGVIPEYFKECWKAAGLGSKYENTQLKIIELPAVALCACGREYEMMKNARICPDCGRSDYQVKSGREFMVREIEAG